MSTKSETMTTHGPEGVGFKVYGASAEFESPDELMQAAKKTVAEGYRAVECYTPFPVHGLDEILNFKDPRLQWTIFLSGITGAAAGFGLQMWVSMTEYPLNVGGRPLFSWPSFIPVTHACTILLSSIGAVVGMLAYNGLPKPYHPVFNAPRFDLATQNRFFLVVEAKDPKFDAHETRKFLETLGAANVGLVEDDSDA